MVEFWDHPSEDREVPHRIEILDVPGHGILHRMMTRVKQWAVSFQLVTATLSVEADRGVCPLAVSWGQDRSQYAPVTTKIAGRGPA